MDNQGYILLHATDDMSLDIEVNVTHYGEAMRIGRFLGSNTQIRTLCITLNDDTQHIRRHHRYMIWLFSGGIIRNRSIRHISFVGVDFGRDISLFTVSLRKWFLRNRSIQKVSFLLCRFRGVQQFVALNQCLSSSQSIKGICFKEIDFTAIHGNKALMMAYLSQAFGQKHVHFEDCHLLPWYLRELVRGISEANHPDMLLIENNRSPLSSNICQLLNRELTNHTSVDSNALISPISVLSLKGGLVGDIGVFALLSRGLEAFALVRLNLSRCNISDPGCAVIAKVLRELRAPFLKKLVLSHNHINDTGAIFIAKALSTNSVLQTLSMSNSQGRMTEHTWLAFQKVLFNDLSPRTIKNSNHVLTNVALTRYEGMITGATQKCLADILLLNQSGCTHEGVELVIREKLIRFAYNLLTDRGVTTVMNRFFPAWNGNDLTQIFLLLKWNSSVYRLTYGADLWINNSLAESEYWVHRVRSTRELTLFYSVIRFRMGFGGALQNTTPFLRSHKRSFNEVHQSVIFHSKLLNT